MSVTFLRTVCGSMPCSSLYASCFCRRRIVSEIACRMESVIWSAYMITWPSTLRAARPIVWISEVAERLDLPRDELGRLIQSLTDEMQDAARDLRFEEAARLRDEIHELKRELREVS